MTRPEILSFCPSIAGCATNLGALNYRVPTLAWLQGPFWEYFHAKRWSTADDTWKKRYECRDFTRDYAADAIECWANDATLSDDDALAVGEIWFLPDPNDSSSGHAVCPVFTENGLQYIDPQNNTLWRMSTTQFASRYFLRF